LATEELKVNISVNSFGTAKHQLRQPVARTALVDAMVAIAAYTTGHGG